ncbi:MAG: hypothetical protein BroJett018_04020 [Chloroflexota bacterium]|nr:MAG: hypothetical protein BroJett018_04020 [Chloroflexota bacterium]
MSLPSAFIIQMAETLSLAVSCTSQTNAIFEPSLDQTGSYSPNLLEVNCCVSLPSEFEIEIAPLLEKTLVEPSGEYSPMLEVRSFDVIG